MTETRTTKIKYIIQYKDQGTEDWMQSDWTAGLSDNKTCDIDYMLALLKRARESMARCIAVNNRLTNKEYRLLKQTHSITTEVVDE